MMNHDKADFHDAVHFQKWFINDVIIMECSFSMMLFMFNKLSIVSMFEKVDA